jgi:hypothetical protein
MEIIIAVIAYMVGYTVATMYRLWYAHPEGDVPRRMWIWIYNRIWFRPYRYYSDWKWNLRSKRYEKRNNDLKKEWDEFTKDGLPF